MHLEPQGWRELRAHLVDLFLLELLSKDYLFHEAIFFFSSLFYCFPTLPLIPLFSGLSQEDLGLKCVVTSFWSAFLVSYLSPSLSLFPLPSSEINSWHGWSPWDRNGLASDWFSVGM